MISVVLVEPEHAMNVGAVARVMANFGMNKLVLVNPKCDHKSMDAVMYAKHARSILAKAKVVSSLAETTCDVLVATTAKVGTDYNLVRSPITPKQLALTLPASANVGLVFGREGNGLYTHEIEQCGFVVTIPASKTYSTLNLSHAIAVVLYELFVSRTEDTSTSHIRSMSAKEHEQTLKMLDSILEKMSFASEQKRQTQRTLWKKMLAKSFLSRREAFALMGFLRKLL